MAQKLDELDNIDASILSGTKLTSVKLDPEADAHRIKLLKEMEIKIKEYCKDRYLWTAV